MRHTHQGITSWFRTGYRRGEIAIVIFNIALVFGRWQQRLYLVPNPVIASIVWHEPIFMLRPEVAIINNGNSKDSRARFS